MVDSKRSIFNEEIVVHNKTETAQSSDMITDKIAYEMDSFREEYAPEESCQFRSITTNKKHKSQLFDKVIMNLKLSDDQLASVSHNSREEEEDEKKSEDDEFDD